MSKSERLKTLITEREEKYGEYTVAIQNEAKEVLEGIALYLGKPFDDIIWDYMEVEDFTLIITAVVKMNDVQKNSIDLPSSIDKDQPMHQAITFGVPLNFVNGRTREHVCDFLVEMEHRNQDLFLDPDFDEDDVEEQKSERVLH